MDLMYFSARKQPGQAILVILLVMVVGLTMGLSLATRSVSDLKISGQSEDSAKAFSAAEAGIEAVLANTGVGTSGCLGNACYLVSTVGAGGSDVPFSPGNINIADTYNVWLDGYSGNSLDVCWQKTDPTSVEPALEISVLYLDGTYKVWRGAYDPNSTRTMQNNFNYSNVATNFSCAGVPQNKVTVTLLGTKTIALRVRPFYASVNLTVVPLASYNLPTQGLTIASSGTSGQTTRKVIVTQSYGSLPSIFDNVLFSGKDLVK